MQSNGWKWIRKNESGTNLCDTLKNEIGITNNEIGAAGFDLEEYFTDPDGEEKELSRLHVNN